MKTKIGINGFGRIGRLVFRAALTHDDVEVVGLNDPFMNPEYMAYMLKYDSVHGKFPGEVSAEDGALVVNGKKYPVFTAMEVKDIPWASVGAEYICECTGKHLTKELCQGHIDAGAKHVVMGAPSKDDTPMFVMGVNNSKYTSDMTFVSNASCTTNCLAPMAKALNDYAPIQSGIMSTIHAYTGDQMILDGPHRKGDKRRARAGAANIVPNSTGAAKAIGLVIPELNGKLIGSAQRVPVPTGSTTILTAVVKGSDVTKEGINAAMKAAASASFGYNEDPIVSSDVIGMRFGSLFDATQTMVAKIADDLYEVQVVSWYDNENSYTSQMVRTIKYFAELSK
nr:MAG TPA: glyceraldehyde-3-phosphate dehydrogenase, type I [Caudoviricetes sp.]